MNSGTSLSSTPRKNVAKPTLRLSIPSPVSSPQKSIEARTNGFGDAGCRSVTPNRRSSPSDLSMNKSSELEKLIASERMSGISNKFRSDGSSAQLSNMTKAESSVPSTASSEFSNDTNNNPTLLTPSYSKFESDFRKRVEELNASSRFDMHLRGKKTFFAYLKTIDDANESTKHKCILIAENSPIFSHMKTMSSSTPNTPSRSSPRPHFSRIISLSPTIHYSLNDRSVSKFLNFHLFYRDLGN